MITKRLVFLFPGFEPMRADRHAERFRRAAERSASVWNVDLEIQGTQPDGTDAAQRFRSLWFGLSGQDWQTTTELVICDWGDIIIGYAQRPAPIRFFSGLYALSDFLLTGTFFRYCRVSWRYALFFLFPLLVVAAACALAWIVYAVIAAFFIGIAGKIVGVLAGLLAGWALLFLAQRRLHLLTAMDDWALARALCRGQDADMEARIERQARELSDRLETAEADEVIIAAHSLGAGLAVRALAKALSGSQATRSRPSGFLTVGSSLLKIALHPSAASTRKAVRHLVVDHELPWTDCQSLSDPINFYKSNPALSLKIREGRTPTVLRVHFKRLLSTATYKRIRRDFFRVHRQFVLAVERKAPYSFHMLLLGPRPLADFTEKKTLDLPPLSAGRLASVGESTVETNR